jgi:hypothetical protein
LAVPFLLTLLFSIVCSLAMAQTSSSSVGIKVGNQFTYSTKFSLADGVSIDSLDANTLSFYNGHKNGEWLKITVTQVNGSVVDFTLLAHFDNGAETTGTTSANVDSGLGGAFPIMYASGLSAGSPLYSTPIGELRSPTATVDETISKEYASGSRLTNYVKTLDYSITLWSSYKDLYFDKETGMLVQETHLFTVNGSTPFPFNASTSLIQSNVWSVGSSNQVPEFPITASLVAVLAAVSLLLVMGKRKLTRINL